MIITYAILVGAGTIRCDDPRLLVRSAQRQQQRQHHGRPRHPMKVTLTGRGEVDPAARFFKIHLAIAPFFVGDPRAPRFVEPGQFPQNPQHRMTLAETRQLGDVVLLRYLPHR